MNIPEESFEIIVIIILVCVAMALVNSWTRSGRNFRSRRNKKARKQF